MGKSSERVLYLGCGHIPIAGCTQGVEGVYEVKINGSVGDVRPLGLKNERVMAMITDIKDPRRIYVGSAKNGILRSDDGGETFREVTRGLTHKEIWSLAQHPVTGELYAGTQPADIFRSRDGGETWEELRGMMTSFDRREWSFPGPPFLAHVKWMDFMPDDPNYIIAAVEEGWLVRTTDGGKSFDNLRIGVAFDAHTANVMPDNPKVIVATAGIGCYRSTDGGNKFVESMNGMEQRYLTPIAFHKQNPQRLFCAASEVPPPFWIRPEASNSVFYRSDDQGQNWQKLTHGVPEGMKEAPRCVKMDPQDPNTVFVGMSDGSVYMTRNGGESFQRLFGGLPPVCSISVTYQ